jgi:hypothetical protein
MLGSKDRSCPGWKDGTHWCIRQSPSWLKSNGDARARKVGIKKISTGGSGSQAESWVGESISTTRMVPR